MDKTEETDPPRTVEAVELSLSILEALADLECARVTELAEHLDRSKSGVYWHLVTLREGGFVAKDGDMYCLGRQFVEYGERTKRSFLGNFSKAKEELNRLAFETGEFTQLLVENEGYGLFVAKSGGEDAIGATTTLANTNISTLRPPVRVSSRPSPMPSARKSSHRRASHL